MPAQGFFHDASADRLMDPDNHPEGIVEFLRTEREVLADLAPTIDGLVEVACMDGRHLEFAVERSLGYLGIDLVARHVAAGRRRVDALGLSAGRHQFVEGDAQALPAVVEGNELLASLQRPLVLLPFSIFSALPHVDDVAAGLRQLGMPFLISLYRPTEKATTARHEYYLRCGYTGVEISHDVTGVRLRTADGLHTVAYHPEYLDRLWARHGMRVATIALSDYNLVCVPEALRRAAGGRRHR